MYHLLLTLWLSLGPAAPTSTTPLLPTLSTPSAMRDSAGRMRAFRDPITLRFGDPSAAQLKEIALQPRLQLDTFGQSREALVEEQVVAPAGGFRVRLGSAFVSAIRGTKGASGVSAACLLGEASFADDEQAADSPGDRP